jgi:hypothetical protein
MGFRPPLPLAPVVWVAVAGTCIYGQVYRYRRISSPAQRQRTKWVILGVSAALVGYLGVGVVQTILSLPPTAAYVAPPQLAALLISAAVADIFVMLIPLSIGIAILRYQLFDIDVLINRALVYGSLTGLLTGVFVALYFGIVLLLHALLLALAGPGAQQNIVASTLAVAASTLAVVALFQPVRRRLQTGIDHRFYRRKYDAARTLEAFGGGLRREVDLMDLGERLVAVVRDTMQPSQVSLWLRASEGTEAEISGQDGEQDALWAASLAGSDIMARAPAPTPDVSSGGGPASESGPEPSPAASATRRPVRAWSDGGV